MGQKGRSFCRMKNKEQGREKQKVSDWLRPNLVCGKKGVKKPKYRAQSIEPRVGMKYGESLTGCTAFLVKQSIYRDIKVLKFPFADLAS